MCHSDLDMSLQCPLADGHKRRAILAHEMRLLHVCDEAGPESRDVIALVAFVGLDVTVDGVHMVLQLLLVVVSKEIRLPCRLSTLAHSRSQIFPISNI